MSDQCPATVVYELEEPQTSHSITNCQELLDHWEHSSSTSPVPDLVQVLMTNLANVVLANEPHLKYFSFWTTLNAHFQHFGKLYQNVAERLAVTNCKPGTTLIARGNQVHAGPPSNIPRMFAFCIGIPDDNIHPDDNGGSVGHLDGAGDDKEDQNGEIQYNPVLLHADLCCILFTSLDFDDKQDYQSKYDAETILATKEYLLGILPDMIREHPHETYARLLGDDRASLRKWLGDLVQAVSTEQSDCIERLIDKAVTSSTILLSPDVSQGTPWRRKRDKAVQKKKKKQVEQQVSPGKCLCGHG